MAEMIMEQVHDLHPSRFTTRYPDTGLRARGYSNHLFEQRVLKGCNRLEKVILGF